MSARMNMNTIRPVSWKGKTFNQVVAGLKMNTRTFSKESFFLPPPVKHYRLEIANTQACNTRAGDVFYQPGGTVVTTSSNSAAYTSELNIQDNMQCKSVDCVKADDARRRVRSSGNIRNTSYCTSSNEYMISRSKTIKQNEYSHVRYGDPSYKPGSPESIQNVYQPNGLSHCSKVAISGYDTSSNPLFNYQWINGTVYNFTIADGRYDIDELNNAFRTALIANKHYYNDNATYSKVYLFNFVYSTMSDTVQIQCFATSSTIHASPRYTVPASAGWVSPTGVLVPVIKILNNNFQSVLGVSVGNYPPADISGNQFQPSTNTNVANNIYGTLTIASRNSLYGISYPNSIAGNQFKTGTTKPSIGTPYVPLYYKPSNSKFATQGGVDSSSRLTRLKYDTITSSANTYMTAYGKQTANALAYGVPGPRYTLKDRIGYKQTCTPTAKLNAVVSCQNTKIMG